MEHLTIRVAWHDNKWNGTICNAPSLNDYCLALERIRKERNDTHEERVAGRAWGDLKRWEMPPCTSESGGFMSDREWIRWVEPPFQNALPETHGNLRQTAIRVEPFTALAVPFRWMLRENQRRIDDSLREPLPTDEIPPFYTPWVFSRTRQDALSQQFFGRLTPEQSLVFFYCKEGHPLGDSVSRLIVGIGRIEAIGPQGYYDSDGEAAHPYWDRKIQHTIRPEGADGFLLPYHDYLASTGDPDEDSRRRNLLETIAVAVAPAHVAAFSYTSELASADIALSTLMRCLDAVRLIRAHGVARGSWDVREQWLNNQIAATWRDRGEFPGIGSVLEALGLRMGTSLMLDLMRSGRIGPEDNPWHVVDAILRGTQPTPHPSYAPHLARLRPVWVNLSEERRNLLHLLSRFALSPEQAFRWFHPASRAKAVGASYSDADILENPYRIAEADLSSDTSPAIPMETIDHGLFPDDAVRVRYPLPPPTSIDDLSDIRRIRAALVTILRTAADEGDTLLSTEEALARMAKLPLALPPLGISVDWLMAYRTQLADAVTVYNAPTEGTEDHIAPGAGLVQLMELRKREDFTRKVLQARSAAILPSLQVDWRSMLIEALGDSYQADSERHREALDEQVVALERITTRRLSVLTGRAGTGKTSVLGALLACQWIRENGVLLLAPTGKARVRLQRASGKTLVARRIPAYTVAHFLHTLRRYDTNRQSVLFAGDTYKQARTVVIDEASMLTLNDLAAVLLALDLVHVQRIILVGDPNQLPPIGAGRPLADLVAYLDALGNDESSAPSSQALARLMVEVRTRAGSGPSDALRLASWFTRDPQPVDADRVLDQVISGVQLNDLDICFWKTPEDLHRRILEKLKDYLGVQGRTDIAGFDRALGIGTNGYVPVDNPDRVEHFQILSPIRMQPYGVYALNRWLQWQFRRDELRRANGRGGKSLGQETIVHKDKVIQVRNERRTILDWQRKAPVKGYLANGEIGIVARGQGEYMNVAFAGHPHHTVGYKTSPYINSECPLELAYALTVHKAQGSQFDIVFVIIPNRGRGTLHSRELLYTAFTRAREQLVLFVEGDDARPLYQYSLPSASETARRNTNLFTVAARTVEMSYPLARNLIHCTRHGQLVRSKSELVIANMLEDMNIPYKYEDPFVGDIKPGWRCPDFTFATAEGGRILWEHLGMLTFPDYARRWEDKRTWYAENGFVTGVNLFTTRDDERGGLDSREVRKVAERIQTLISL